MENIEITDNIETGKNESQNSMDITNSINNIDVSNQLKSTILSSVLNSNSNNKIVKREYCKIIVPVNRMKPLSTVLSEHTSKEDLFGRDVINKDNSITFVPGILIRAFMNGNVLILNECDLANPEVLSSILNSLTKNKK